MSETSEARQRELPPTLLTFVSGAGIIFLLIALFMFGLAAYLFIPQKTQTKPEDVGLVDFIPQLVVCGIGIFTSFLGVGLIRSAGFANRIPSSVVSPAEWITLRDAVEKGDEDSVSQYIRLTSLTGITGLFAKLELRGLPLATIALTVFFTLLYAFNGREFLDLAKLTLGAFIGSFVQRQVGAGQSSGKIKLPDGNVVNITTPAPTVA